MGEGRGERLESWHACGGPRRLLAREPEVLEVARSIPRQGIVPHMAARRIRAAALSYCAGAPLVSAGAPHLLPKPAAGFPFWLASGRLLE